MISAELRPELCRYLDVDTAAPEIIASFGGEFKPDTDIITTAQTFTIIYDNGTDGEGTTGALVLQIVYLDADFLSQTAIHVLGSTGTDVTSFSGLGINRCIVITTGTALVNTGDITITATTDGSTQAAVPAGGGVTQQCLYHFQINHIGLLDWVYGSALRLAGGGSPRVIIRGMVYNRFIDSCFEVLRIKIDTDVENSFQLTPSQPLVLSGRDVLWLEAETDVNNTEVAARFSFIEQEVSS